MNSLPLGKVVEGISRNLEQQLEDPAYGVKEVVDRNGPTQGRGRAFGRLAREVFVETVAAIVAAVVSPLVKP